MKNNILVLTLILSSLSFGQHKTDVSSFSDKYLNWYADDIKQDKNNGVSVTKAYKELLANKKPKQKIIVAVIDGGVDPLHEDLKNMMWRNPTEIPDNGIDDDKNGYIDDIFGWNFLGNKKGENIDGENLESTRIYRRLKEKYQDIDNESVTDKTEYELYKKLDKNYWKNRNNYAKEYKEISQMKTAFDYIYLYLEGVAGKKLNSVEEVKAVETEDEQANQFIDAIVETEKQGLTRSDLDAYYKQTKNFYEHYYNINFNPRQEILGDDVTSIENPYYGNPDVKGTDAFHGTFCAGIIGAQRDNNIGIDGIANHIEIMALRAVPSGDEYDKDVALSIRYAVDNGAKIINMSFGKDYSPEKILVDDAIQYAEEKGVLLVHAAGNDSKNIDVNSNFPDDLLNSGETASNVITVGASSIYKNKYIPADFSNYGKEKVDVFAPGVDIVSLSPDNTYDQADGTSFAAPVVSGVAALVWSYYPELSAKELKEVLFASVTNYGKKKVKIPTSGKGKKTRFKNLNYTGGIVNAYSAFKAAETLTKK